jgi:hypothetical protein
MAMRMGRPRKSKAEKRGKPLRVLLNEAERRALDVHAGNKSLDTSTWARTTLLEIVGYKKP